MSSRSPVVAPSLSACLCTKCLLSFTFGQTPRTWVGAPISTVRSLRACRTPVQAALSIYARELLAVQLRLFQFRSPLRGRTVVVFCDDSTAVHSLRKGVPLVSSPQPLGSGDLALDGVHLHPPASTVPSRLRLPVSPSPAHTSRVVFTHDRFLFLRRLWPVQMFLCHLGHSSWFDLLLPFPGSVVSSTDAFLQIWDSLRAYAFPPVAVIRVLSRSSGHPRDGTHSCDSPLG